MISSKELQLVFLMEEEGRLTLTIDDPKEDLTIERIQEAAAKIIPVLESASGAHAVSLKNATISTTTKTVLI